MIRHIYLGTKDGKVFLFPESALFSFDTKENVLTVDYEIHHKEFKIADIRSTLVDVGKDVGETNLLVKFFEWIASKINTDEEVSA